MKAGPLVALLLCAITQLQAREVTITVLATTDLHGNIYPYDYFTAKPAERGLAKIATLIKQERKTAPSALLVDCGDTIQGAPIESVWQGFVRTGKLPLGLEFKGKAPRIDPMMLVMNHLRYDAMALGNHEFNFGLENMARARGEAKFPWLSANTRTASRRPFAPYLVKSVDGVKVAILGLTTPAVPSWEKPENIADYKFADARTAALEAMAELRTKHKPDLVIAAIHAGLDRDLKTGAIRQGDQPKENMVYQLAMEVPGIDAIVFGHTHQQVEDYRLNGVLLMQPRNWGMSLGRMDFKLESNPTGGYRIVSKSSRLLPVNESVPPDPAVLKLARPYQEITERFLDTVVANSPATLSANEARIKDTAIIDAVQNVQLHFAKADVSFSAAFNPRAALAKGPVTVRQIAGLYIYDNELYAVKGNGKMVREALENAARFYNSCKDESCAGDSLINKSVIPYNYDMAQGVTYDIDLTKPPGSRVRNLKFRGAPLKDDQELRIALNNYRAGGSGGYKMFRGAPILWRSYEDIREMIMRYYTANPIPSQPDNNWRVIPEAARQQLEKEAAAYRPTNQ